MSATDELRAMLDERGVEYEQADGWWTSWETDGVYSYGGTVYCEDLGSGLEIRWHTITPEQAIAATLGHSLNNPSMSETLSERETCTIEREERGCNFAYRLYTLSCGHTVWTMDDAPNFCPSCGRKVEQ